MIFSVSFNAASERKCCAALHGLCFGIGSPRSRQRFGFRKFAYAAILILAAGASTLIVTQQPTGTGGKADGARTSLSLTASKPVTITDTLPVAARTGGSLPSHYVLQSRPVSNEQPLSF